ncbi:MAG: glycosyltransferase [Aggregatilineales bacterium]
MKKILFVGMAQSVHLQRWISQIEDQGWEIHLFPSMDIGFVHPNMRHVIVHHSIYAPQPDLHESVKERGLRIGIPFVRQRLSRTFRLISRGLTIFRSHISPVYRVNALERVIKRVKPDVVHAVEFQHGAYLALQVKERMGDQFPPWMVTNYGNDIFLFGRLAEHQARVKAVLEHCDYYTSECERDVDLARTMGLQGKVMPVVPNVGGVDQAYLSTIPRVDPPSIRRQIMLKGYQHFSGRALNGLQAIRQCADILHDYHFLIYSASHDVKVAVELCRQDTGLQIELMPTLSHQEMLEQFGKSRIYMGLSISDGISISSLDALVMGALPIQSFTACSDEWLENGISGLIVPPEDVNAIAEALRHAVEDDAFVDHAAEINKQTTLVRLNKEEIQTKIVGMYQQVFDETQHE